MGVKGNGGTRIQGQVGLGRVRESARGDNHSGYTTKHKGLCADLVNHIFDYVQKASLDQILTTWKKLLHHVGRVHGHHIRNEI